MRFVRVKSAEQQGQLMQHRTRDLLLRQRTQVNNGLRLFTAQRIAFSRNDFVQYKELLQRAPRDTPPPGVGPGG